MGVYTNEAGGEVFTAGSTDWPHGEAETPEHAQSLSLTFVWRQFHPCTGAQLNAVKKTTNAVI